MDDENPMTAEHRAAAEALVGALAHDLIETLQARMDLTGDRTFDCRTLASVLVPMLVFHLGRISGFYSVRVLGEQGIPRDHPHSATVAGEIASRVADAFAKGYVAEAGVGLPDPGERLH